MASNIRNYFTGDLETVLLSINEDVEDERDVYFQAMMARNEKDDVGALFTCDNCGKVCKTTRLSRHQTTKHDDADGIIYSQLPKLNPVVIKELSEKSADNVSKVEYYPENILMELKSFNLDLNQAEQIYMLFKDVIDTYSNNPEKFYPKFYRIVGNLTEFGNLSKNAITLLGFELANQIICFKKSFMW